MLRRERRRGSTLLEFAIVALVSYLLIAAVLTFGSILWIGNTLQQAVDVGAQEIARMPYSPVADLGLGQIESTPPPDSVMFDPAFRQSIYDEQWLVIDPVNLGGQSLADYARDNLPLINRLLVTVYIFDNVSGVYRYPGAIVRNDNNDQTVLIPIVNDGTVTWVAPVEEMRVDIDGTSTGPFSVVRPDDAPLNFEPGVVALRINYPFQSASMSSFREGEFAGELPHRGNIRSVIGADDSMLTAAATGRYSLVIPENAYVDEIPNINAGRYGLGRQFALPFENVGQYGVRPYRRVISVQAIYRREVFSSD